jgi:preprotein translocase subunit Sec61beta
MTSTLKSRRLRAGGPRSAPRAGTRARILAGLELVTGAAAVAGGALLAAAPNGSLLRADPKALAGSPFTDWRIPGVLLAALVGGGFLLAAYWQWRDRRHARGLSVFAGAGLIAFEAAEAAWIGLQPLEAVFAAVGVAVLLLAWRDGRR